MLERNEGVRMRTVGDRDGRFSFRLSMFAATVAASVGAGLCSPQPVAAATSTSMPVPGMVGPIGGSGIEAGAAPIGVSMAASPSPADWLDEVNVYREASGLSPVTDQPAWDLGIQNHLTYMADTPPTYLTGPYVSLHTENPASPYYTPAGAQEAAASDLMFGYSGYSPVQSIDVWLAAPFHAVGMLRPDLTQVAFADDPVTGDAGLDVISGLDYSQPPATSPVLFPGAGVTTDLTAYGGGEMPNPLETCGWSAGVGLPLIALLPQDPVSGLTAQLIGPAGSETTAAGTLCLVDDHTYVSTDPVYGPTGLEILQWDRAVFLIPASPLSNGFYDATINQPGQSPITWSFMVGPSVLAPGPPVVNSVVPSGGLVAGGQTVTVIGERFAGGMTASIGGVAVTPTGVTPTSFTFTAPPEPPGAVDIQVTTSFGSSALTAADEYTYGSVPVISSVTPAGGRVSGGQMVTVTGIGFTAGMTATIGGTAVTPSGVSATSFTFTTPAEAAGAVQVQVTTVIGASAITAADEYTYEVLPMIDAVTPSAGPVSGGQVVTVTGTGFVAAMTATIGGTTVTPSSITASAFTFTTPAKTAGYDQIQVTDLAGASALTPATGYIYTGLGSFVPVTPFRILDTRSGLCGIHTCGALGAGQTLALEITGYTDARTGESVPTTATAVVLNVLAVNGSASSLLTVYPTGTGRPLASNLNFSAHVNIANLVTAALGQNGTSDSQREINIYNAVGTANVVVDIEGYFVPQASSNPAGEFHAIAPLRVCDTRTGQPANGCNLGHSIDNRIGPGQVIEVNVSGIPSGVSGSPVSIPADGSAGAAVLNLTAVAGTQATWLSVFPTQSNGTCPTSAPASSTINVSAGAVLANRVMVPLGPGHSGGPSTDVCVYNAAGTINVLLDASGWFGSTTGSPATGAQYQAIGPTRICDTRSGTGTPCSGHQLTSGGTLLVAVAGVGGIPGSGPVAIIANLTAVSGSQLTYLTVYPADVSPKPNASDLNVQPGIALPNLVVVGLASGVHAGDVNLFNAMGSINAVLDVDGWFQ